MEIGGEYTLAAARAEGVSALRWHNLALRFQGDKITGLVDGREVVSTNSNHYKKGMAGLLAPLHQKRVCTPYFDNLSIKPLGRNAATSPLTARDHRPMYPQH